MIKEYVGLRTHLYTFSEKEHDSYTRMKEKLSHHGQITRVFINNTPYAFEFRQNRVIDIR